jgi:hypothetical protein
MTIIMMRMMMVMTMILMPPKMMMMIISALRQWREELLDHGVGGLGEQDLHVLHDNDDDNEDDNHHHHADENGANDDDHDDIIIRVRLPSGGKSCWTTGWVDLASRTFMCSIR